MPQSALKWLRFITPGILIYGCGAILGNFTALWTATIPSDIRELLYYGPIIGFAIFYYLSPFRYYFNKKFFDNVSENIRRQLVSIAELNDDPNIFTWKALRGIFYHFVDNDESLKRKSSLAYFNGLFWTGAADLQAISLPFAFFSLVVWSLKIDGAMHAALIFLLAAFAGWLGSLILTEKHKAIGNEQLEIIRHKYKSELRTKLESVRDRPNS